MWNIFLNYLIDEVVVFFFFNSLVVFIYCVKKIKLFVN